MFRARTILAHLRLPVQPRASVMRTLASASGTEKKFDIVLWGCTGFTGRLIAEYLTRTASREPLRWALVGRDASRIAEVQRSVSEATGLACTSDFFISSSEDQGSVDAAVGGARVVLCAAGPFINAAGPIVDACVRFGTDYVDITGETPYVKRIIDLHHAKAKQKGVYIVSMCGFDSIPSDVGTYLATTALRKLGQDTVSAACYARMRGQLSGGTVNTGITLETMGPAVVAQMRDPYLLGGPRAAPTSPDVDAAEYSNEAEAWTGPFMMAAINSRVVRRSAMLFEQEGAAYGPTFTYSEKQAVPTEAAAKKLAAPMPDAKAREALVKKGLLPKPGQGPSADIRAKSSFEFTIVAHGSAGATATCVVSGGDPGYDETAKMVSEAALVLARDRHALTPTHAGVVTPAFALADALVPRLRRAGMRFDVSTKP